MRSFWTWPAFVLSVCVGILTASAAGAITHRVPEAFPTIQAGIDASGVGDTVLVAAGLYTGAGNRDLDFGGCDLVLISEEGAEATVIDAEGSSSDRHRGFVFASGETHAAIVDGFTVRGGYAVHADGGGLYCNGASPTIRDCVITSNAISTFNDGGGIYLRDSDARIEGCTVSLNYAMYGAGIACRGATTATIIDCEIVQNTGGYGGGIDAGGIGSPHIIGCLIAGNDATNGFEDPGYGGGMVLGGEARVEDCTIVGNISGHGAGVSAWSGAPMIVGSSIAGNDAGAWWGGGVSANYSTLHLERTVIWGNCGTVGEEFLVGAGGTLSLSCCVYDSVGVTQDGGQFVDAGQNLVADPLFCMPEPCENAPTIAGDYRIDRASPCFPENNPCGEWIGALRVGCPASDVADAREVPVTTILGTIHPNPATHSIAFTVTLAAPRFVSVSLIDLAGRRVATIDERILSAGSHPYRWDAAGSARRIPSGVYYLRLEAGDRVESRRFSFTR